MPTTSITTIRMRSLSSRARRIVIGTGTRRCGMLIRIRPTATIDIRIDAVSIRAMLPLPLGADVGLDEVNHRLVGQVDPFVFRFDKHTLCG